MNKLLPPVHFTVRLATDDPSESLATHERSRHATALNPDQAVAFAQARALLACAPEAATMSFS